jgi:hypothetical protein
MPRGNFMNPSLIQKLGRAARTIGVVTLNGRSRTRATEAFLAHLGAKSGCCETGWSGNYFLKHL